MKQVELEVMVGKKAIPVVLDLPSSKSALRAAVVLMHGASGDLHSGNLDAYASAFTAAGLPCVRFTCKPTNLAHRVKACEAVMEAAQKHKGLEEVERWVMAGHSMGARVASSMAAAHPDKVAACIFSSYPLHPPGQQDKLRDTPLTQLTQPLLFIRGTKDSFSTEDNFSAVMEAMTSDNVKVHTVEGGDHSLKVAGKGSKQATQGALEEVCNVAAIFAAENSVQHEHSSDAKQGAQHTTPASGQTEADATEETKSKGRKRTANATEATKSKGRKRKADATEATKSKGRKRTADATEAPKSKARKRKANAQQ